MTAFSGTASLRLVEGEADIFKRIANAPAAQALLRRVEKESLLSLSGVHAAAQPFVVAWLHRQFPTRPILVITAGVKIQETFHQDLTTWMAATVESKVQGPKSKGAGSQLSTLDYQPSTNPQPLFFPAWDILPHEPKLPHVDVVSERLETLVALAAMTSPTSRAPISLSPQRGEGRGEGWERGRTSQAG